jgi:hypothetical protein
VDYKELIERMRAFNDWRRGGDFEMPHPRQIGMDIDAMCDAIESLLAENERLKAELAKYRDAHVVAWVEVIDSYEGPYHFHGQKLLGVGKHKLIVKPGENK